MSFTPWSVVFGEQPTAAKFNILGSNDAAFHDGSGFDLGVIGPETLEDNAAIIPLEGGPITSGAIVAQVTTAEILLTAGATNNQYGTWDTPFTTLLSTQATIQSGSTHSVLTGTDGSSTTQGHAQAKNTGGSTETITVHITGYGII